MNQPCIQLNGKVHPVRSVSWYEDGNLAYVVYKDGDNIEILYSFEQDIVFVEDGVHVC